MKKLLAYVLVMTYLFSFLDWKVIHFTRWVDRGWLDWMHANEQTYAITTQAVEMFLCAPALALKPVFMEAMKRVEASQEEQNAVTHAPRPTWAGFYHLPVRGESWTFVNWVWWFIYWLPISLIWYLLFARRLL
jgi:hypothetical protein